MSLGQLLVPVGRQPDLGQRPTFAEDKVGVEHCPGSPGSHTHTAVWFIWKTGGDLFMYEKKPTLERSGQKGKYITMQNTNLQQSAITKFQETRLFSTNFINTIPDISDRGRKQLECCTESLIAMINNWMFGKSCCSNTIQNSQVITFCKQCFSILITKAAQTTTDQKAFTD